MYRKLMVVLAAGGATLVMSSTALAAAPTGEYAEFANCPYDTPGVAACIVAKTESGEFIVGKKTVPISKTITLQGGGREVNEEGASEFVSATNDESLSKTPQSVPGGLAGLVECDKITNIVERVLCEAAFENGVTGVNATTEIAGSASGIRLNTGNLVSETGVALTLPVKIHLENPFLGSECYIGSNANPISLELTTGTTAPPPPNESIKGYSGEITTNPAGTIVTVTENVLVDNSFAAPGTTGCGGAFSFLIDPIIESQIGVPSASGENTAVLKGRFKSAEAEEVRKSAEKA